MIKSARILPSVEGLVNLRRVLYFEKKSKLGLILQFLQGSVALLGLSKAGAVLLIFDKRKKG